MSFKIIHQVKVLLLNRDVQQHVKVVTNNLSCFGFLISQESLVAY